MSDTTTTADQPTDWTAPYDPANPWPADLPSDPHPRATGPGHWEWSEEYDGETGDQVRRVAIWITDPPRPEAEIKAELAREQLTASIALQAELTATLQPLQDAVDKLDPAVIRRPAGGLDVMGVTVIGQAELNSTRDALGDLAEALQAVTAAVKANASANEASIAATVAVLDAVPEPMTLLAMAADPTPETI